ncbi:hypothetical protein MHM98_15250 [Psychrobium sp. MM17-31]|uniref:hypothetical protein n=1 Tax=Psychrobium sp. MM17-31 TaxID=2917758 RepID=UPI001EF6D163|nr:hypothetical protein [Psychrobium sp. MM17-31]MCG7532690.1 hypothetical protein [Psychrobium sp. MM17-31]
MEASIIDFMGYRGNETYIESLNYDLDFLRIVIAAGSNLRIEVCFHQPIGFRCLDEGDLLEFWSNKTVTDNWLLRIHDSGWLAQENHRDGFLSKHSALNEFLVKGQNECLNVLSTVKPTINLI